MARRAFPSPRRRRKADLALGCRATRARCRGSPDANRCRTHRGPGAPAQPTGTDHLQSRPGMDQIVAVEARTDWPRLKSGRQLATAREGLEEWCESWRLPARGCDERAVE